MNYQYSIKGEPIVLKRHRWSRGKTYNPSKQQQIEFAQKCKLPEIPIKDILEIDLIFYCERPKSHQRMKSPPIYPKRKDLDNLIKFVLDAFNKNLYEDDSQVIKITAIKLFDSDPRTCVIVKPFNQINPSDSTDPIKQPTL
jgi:Holliday junction resolvase RusA-like endonuclease